MDAVANSVYIMSCVRTPIGSYAGVFASLPATALGAQVIKAAVQRSNIPETGIQQIVMGNVLSAGLGQASARQAAILAGLPETVCATTINKVCASGIKAVAMIYHDLVLGNIDAGVAGGMENMSKVPHYISGGRFGFGYGNQQLIDGLEKDGLTDAFGQLSMGCLADKTAADYSISRKMQDDYAEQSYRKSQAAWAKGAFSNEVMPIDVPQRKGQAVTVVQDEECYKSNFEKMRTLKPAFLKEGTITAANASPMSDGASALVLAGSNFLLSSQHRPIARIIAYAEAEQAPALFTATPVSATQKVLAKAKLNIETIDFFEVNEAFSMVPVLFMKLLNVPAEKVNVHGGAVSMGHPLGASGARILTTLLNVLKQNNARYGLAAICNGGGGASAMIVEYL